MKKLWILSLLCVSFLLSIDQISKHFFYNQELFSGKFFFEPLFNPWISRGISMPIAVTLIISLICLFFFIYLFYKKYLTFWEFSLFIAWTLGNLADRIFLWGVRDFIAIGNFPVFNIADIFLSVAVGLICLRELLHLQRNRKTLNR